MTRLAPEEAQDLARRALEAVGASAAHAYRVASGLVGSDLAGVTTHGLAQLPRYVAAARAGELKAHPAQWLPRSLLERSLLRAERLLRCRQRQQAPPL